jgi:hypothetical protein
MKKILTLPIFIILCSYLTAQLSVTSENQIYTISFDTSVNGINNGCFQGLGISSTPEEGQLNSNGIILNGFSDGNMIFGGDYTSGDFARGTSTGFKTTGGIYAFEVESNNKAIGIQPGETDFTPGEIILKIHNNSGLTTQYLKLNYDVWVLNNEDRSSNFSFSIGSNNIDFSPISALDISTETNANTVAIWEKTTKSITISNTINNGDFCYLMWSSNDNGGSGSRDEIALDNIQIQLSTDQGVPNAIGKENKYTVNVFPNPVINNLHVASEYELTQFTLINSTGNVIVIKDSINSSQFSYNTNNLPQGVYVLKITDILNNVYIKRIVKK